MAGKNTSVSESYRRAMPRKARWTPLIAAGFSSGDISVLLPTPAAAGNLRMRPMRRTLRQRARVRGRSSGSARLGGFPLYVGSWVVREPRSASTVRDPLGDPSILRIRRTSRTLPIAARRQRRAPAACASGVHRLPSAQRSAAVTAPKKSRSLDDIHALGSSALHSAYNHLLLGIEVDELAEDARRHKCGPRWGIAGWAWQPTSNIHSRALAALEALRSPGS